MNRQQRGSIENGIWCCNVHADIIDRDLSTFSVATLHEWKRLAELNAYEQIDSSHTVIERPHTLVQLSDAIIFEAVWHSMNVESNTMGFEVLDFVYGDIGKVTKFIEGYHNLKDTRKYVVVESSGYGRQLGQIPVIDDVEGQKQITLVVQDRTEYSNPNNVADARLVFTDQGTDIDLTTNDGWTIGKDAVIQSVQLLLGSNRGQWALDPDFGSYVFKYYKDHHTDHELLQRLIKLEISRMTSVPDATSLLSPEPSIPISTIKWVESVKISGHSTNLLEIDLRLYFADNTYFSGRISVPASIE